MKTTVHLSDGDSSDVHIEPSGEGAACIFDGAQGWHNIYRVIDLAVSHGMVLTAEDTVTVDAYREDMGTSDVSEFTNELSDEAEQFLTGMCPDGWSFGWQDGDFFLANEAWWEASS